ncbi:hypothetical protein THAOC_23518, partial [Thalassiosira oceanica]
MDDWDVKLIPSASSALSVVLFTLPFDPKGDFQPDRHPSQNGWPHGKSTGLVRTPKQMPQISSFAAGDPHSSATAAASTILL